MDTPVNTFASDPDIGICGHSRTFNECHNHEQSHSPTSEKAGNMNGARRSRTIRLIRPCKNGTSRRVGVQPSVFGFAVRGGREFGIGFYVSRIDQGGEADVRGLKIGDQLVRVNGFSLNDAVHCELHNYVACQDRLTMKVLGVGILPVKDNPSDVLSWHDVLCNVHSSEPLVDQSMLPSSRREDFSCRDVRITLKVELRTKLGLGICKGPEWKPGIFVQFTKAQSVARDAGLRPGDQLISCNGVDFANVLFSEAVSVMKATQHLELVVRTAAGRDLFPGESSGYNSSTSSMTGGDQSPCWGDPNAKRLSMVREEDTVSNKNHHHNLEQAIRGTGHSDNIAQSALPTNISLSFQSGPFVLPHDNRSRPNTTIIKLSETGTIINNTMVPLIAEKMTHISKKQGEYQDSKRNSIAREHQFETSNMQQQHVADICFVSRKTETKTVTVEVHKDTECKQNNTNDTTTTPPTPPPPPPPLPQPPTIPILSTNEVLTSSHRNNTLSVAESLNSAINEELEKRALRGINEAIPSRSLKHTDGFLTGRIDLKKVRSTFGANGPNSENKHNALIDEFKLAHKKMFQNSLAVNIESLDKSRCKPSDASLPTLDKHVKIYEKNCQHESHRNPQTKLVQNTSKASSELDQSHHAVVPTPQSKIPMHDRSINIKSAECSTAWGDAAELESIDSYMLINPESSLPKPPASYFHIAGSGPATLKKPTKPMLNMSIVGNDIASQVEYDPLSSEHTDYESVDSKYDGQKYHLKPTQRDETEKILPSNTKLFQHKTQSNVEKITAMLVSQNLMGSRSHSAHSSNETAAISGRNVEIRTFEDRNPSKCSTRVTINVDHSDQYETSSNPIDNKIQMNFSAGSPI